MFKPLSLEQKTNKTEKQRTLWPRKSFTTLAAPYKIAKFSKRRSKLHRNMNDRRSSLKSDLTIGTLTDDFLIAVQNKSFVSALTVSIVL